MTLADRIVLLRDGVIEQEGSPLDMFERPVSQFVAGFLGSPQMNFIPCRVDRESGEGRIVFEDGRTLPLPLSHAGNADGLPSGDLIFGVRPEHMVRADTSNSQRDAHAPITVTIDLVQPTGTRTYAQFQLGEVETTVELPAHSVERPGTNVELLFDMARVILIDPETEKVLYGAG